MDGVGAIYEWPKNRRAVGCDFWVYFQLLSASKSIPQGAGIDVARSYIALALGLLLLNCLRGGIGWGIVRYNVYWNIGPSRPFASIAIGMRSLLLGVSLQSRLCLVQVDRLSCCWFCWCCWFWWVFSSRSPEERRLHWQLSGFVALAMVISKPIVLYSCEWWLGLLGLNEMS